MPIQWLLKTDPAFCRELVELVVTSFCERTERCEDDLQLARAHYNKIAHEHGKPILHAHKNPLMYAIADYYLYKN